MTALVIVKGMGPMVYGLYFKGVNYGLTVDLPE